MSSPSSSTTGATFSPQPAFSNRVDGFDTFTRSIFLFVFFILFIRVCFIYLFNYRNQGHNPNTSNHVGDDDNTGTGLPINIINSYYTFHYSKKCIADISNKEHYDTCSICISDYKESEILRIMPKCCHYFHRDCVDAWLKIKGSCPICRYSLTELAV